MENLLSFKKLFIAAICSLFALTLTAQVSYSPGGCDGAAPYGGPNINPSAVKESKNGWVLPVNGTINVLVIFAEINYDVTADPYGAPSANWQQGQLPVFKNQLYDPVISTNPTGIITKYFKEASFGNYNVIGDYIIDPLNPNVCITVNQSDFAAQGGQFGALFTKINSFANFQTANNVTITDFDNWTLTSDGEPKIFPSVDLPNKYDHVCVVWRNSTSPINQNGYTGQGSLGNIFGLVMDSYQVVTGHDNIPYNIMKHEYGHLMVGGNNFHIDGGGQNNYFLPRVEVGWGVMTAANGSLQTCSSWDRDRFDWKGPGKTMTISCRNAANTAEVIGDLDATNATQAGTYILRDFQTTGDAVRIKLPNTPAGKYEQWLWIENHNGFAMNGSVFDKFMYQDNPCRQTALYGLYAYIQIDKNVKSGPNTYGGNGNFKRTVCADGNFDYTFDGSQILNTCIAYGMAQPFQKYVPNPLSGDQDQQIIHHDKNNDLSLFGDAYSPFLETKILAFFDNLAMHGLSRHAFTYQGNKKIGIGSNPSPASKMNLSNSSTLELSDVKNLRSIYLNGISVEIINQAANGEITVLVRFDDIDVNNNVSWCGDDIVLSPPHVSTAGGLALNVKAGKIITLDQSTTPSRYTTPINYNGQNVFADPTVFRIKTGAIAQLEANSKIIVQNGSTLLLEPGGQIDMLANTEIRVKTGSKLIMDQYSYINNYGGKIIIEDGATLEYTNGLVNLFNSTSTLEIAGLLDLKTPLSGNNVFKIGGDGYIKFNSPNTSGNNINCGNDCYIEFGNSNNSTTQKVVELLQSKLIIPTNLMGLSFMHGKYFFQGGSYIQSSGINTGVLFNYATITSTSVGYNGHSGIRLSGQPTNASYSNFYNGAYGIYNVQTAGGNSISLTNCVLIIVAPDYIPMIKGLRLPTAILMAIEVLDGGHKKCHYFV
ncbi:MAG: hypothetical protein IPJ79_04185 [Bacteroidetes bacterium]|nr:hypothetical protein [Bacteroidota bacterium]